MATRRTRTSKARKGKAKTKKSRTALDGKEVRQPAISVGVGWLLLAIGYGFWRAEPGTAGAFATWFVGLWAFCMLDLAFMVKALASVIQLMTETRPDRRGPLIVQTIFWGFLKLACLGAIGFLLVKARGTAPSIALWLGVATIVVVPLGGGFWWSRRQLEEG